MRLMDEEHVYHIVRLRGQPSVTGTWLRVSYLICQRGYHTLLRGLMYVGHKGPGLGRGSSHNGSMPLIFYPKRSNVNEQKRHTWHKVCF